MANLKYKFFDVNSAFLFLLEKAYNQPDYITSPRGLETRELLSTNIEILSPRERIIKNEYRKFSLKYSIAEWLWYERGSSSLEEIAFYSKFWRKVSDNGITVNSAYGARILGKYPHSNVNQWEYVKNTLKEDPDSRRAIIVIPHPNDMLIQTKDFICTVYLQFFIRENKLHLLTNMRSNDLILGFANDVFTFTLFQEKMLLELKKNFPKLELGSYSHYSGSSHIYKGNFEMVEEILKNPHKNKIITMPVMNNISEINNLQYNEKIIRENRKGELKELKDDFCLFCQNILLNS